MISDGVVKGLSLLDQPTRTRAGLGAIQSRTSSAVFRSQLPATQSRVQVDLQDRPVQRMLNDTAFRSRKHADHYSTTVGRSQWEFCERIIEFLRCVALSASEQARCSMPRSTGGCLLAIRLGLHRNLVAAPHVSVPEPCDRPNCRNQYVSAEAGREIPKAECPSCGNSHTSLDGEPETQTGRPETCAREPEFSGQDDGRRERGEARRQKLCRIVQRERLPS